jgi:hypothetical protein
LFVGEGPDLLAINPKHPKELSVSMKRYENASAGAPEIDNRAVQWITGAIGLGVGEVDVVNERLPTLDRD